MKVIRLLPALFLSVAAIAAEVPITPLVEGPTMRSQFAEAGATDGNDFLFVWADGRAGAYERRAARVTREGEVLDRDGIRLPLVYSRTSVVWTGTSYLVVWGDDYPSKIRALRIDRDGTIIDGPRTLMEEAAPTSVISNGTHVVIAYHGHHPPYGAFDKRALFLDASAEIVADVLLEEPASRGTASIAWNGTHFVAVFVSDVDPEDPQYAIHGVRFDVTGLLDAAPRKLLEDSSTSFVAAPAIASDGDDFLMINRQSARRLSADLATIGAPQLLPALDYELLPQLNYSSPIVRTGASYVIFGHDGHAITAVQLDRDGRTIGSDVVERTTGVSLANPVAVSNGRELLVGWTGRFSPDPEIGTDVFGTLVSTSTLDRRLSTLLSVSPQQQRRPLIASGGTNLLAAWQEGAGLFVRRLHPDGSPLDAAPLRLAERGAPAAVVFNGSDYFVVYPGLHILRVPRDGALRVEGGTTLANAYPLAAASNGSVTMLLWVSESALYVSRIRDDGSLEGSVQLSESAGNAALAPSDGDFLAVWEETGPLECFCTPPLISSTVRAARVSEELVQLDAGGFDVAAASPFETAPAAVWNGQQWLVVWQSLASDLYAESRYELRGRHVARSGITGEPAFIAEGGNLPSIAWDGMRYYLTWHDPFSAVHAAYLPRLGSPTLGRTVLRDRVTDRLPISLARTAPGVVAAAYAHGDVSRAFLNFAAPRRRAVR